MYTKAAFLNAIKLETKVIKHLATQIPANTYDYRPTPAQRSTLELLRYLAIGGAGAAAYAATGGWEAWEKLDAQAKLMQPGDIAKALDRQAKAIASALKPYTDAKLQKKKIKTWSGISCTLGEGMVTMVLMPMVAYRMQLFLYAKASGASHLTTSDCWHGKAAKPKKPAKAAKAASA